MEHDVGLEADTQPDVVEIETDRESLSSVEQRKILAASLHSRMKTTYRSPERKSLVRNPDWKAMSSLDLEEDPFQQV